MSLNELTVILIEDDDLDAEVVSRAFRKRKLNAEVFRASNGDQGMVLVREQIESESTKPFVVLLDLNMPRVNGHEFLELVRADSKLQAALIFVLTTSSHERDVSLAYQRNVAGYFTKEQVAELISALECYRDGALFPRLK